MSPAADPQKCSSWRISRSVAPMSGEDHFQVDSRAVKWRTLRSVLVGMFTVGVAVVTGEVLAGPLLAPTSLLEVVVGEIPPEVRDLAPSLTAETTVLTLLLVTVLGGCLGLLAVWNVKVTIVTLCILGIGSAVVQNGGFVDSLHIGPSIQVPFISTAVGLLVFYISHRLFVPRQLQEPIATDVLYQDSFNTLQVTEDDAELCPIPETVKKERDRLNWSKGYHAGYVLGLHEGHEEGKVAGHEAASSKEAARGHSIKGQPSRYAVAYRKGKHAFGYEMGLAMGYRGARSVGRAEEARQNGYRKGHAKGRYNLGKTTGRKEGWQVGQNVGQRDGYVKGHPEGRDKGSREGYSKGWTDGHRKGHEEGHRKGYHERYDEGHRLGYNRGLPAGKDEGRRDGYEEGRRAGYTEGHRKGYDESYAEAQKRGHREGYSIGMDKGRRETDSAT